MINVEPVTPKDLQQITRSLYRLPLKRNHFLNNRDFEVEVTIRDFEQWKSGNLDLSAAPCAEIQ